MYILINEQQIGVAEMPTVTRSKYDGTDTIKIVIPKENLTASEIDELCDYIRENAPVIEYYDNDEKVRTFDGFSLYPVYAPSKEGTVWNLTIENESELKFQYGLLKDRAESLEKQNAAMEKTINTQAQALTEHASVITKQAETITAQAKQVTSLEEMSAAQLAAIDSILTEVVPNIIELSVTQAVEAVLATQEETTEEPIDETTDEESDVVEE